MNIDPTNNDPTPETPLRPLEKVLRELARDANIPNSERIEEKPPSKEILESVRTYVEKLGFNTESSGTGVMTIASEIFSRNLMGVGRVGTHEGFPVLAFLRQTQSDKVDVVAVFPKDGVDARKLGQAIYWGLVSDVPLTKALSKLISRAEFRAIVKFDPSQLCDAPVLEKLSRELTTEADRRIRSSLNEQRALEKQVQRLQDALADEQNASAQFREEAVVSHNRAERWKLISMSVAGCAALLLLLFMHGRM